MRVHTRCRRRTAPNRGQGPGRVKLGSRKSGQPPTSPPPGPGCWLREHAPRELSAAVAGFQGLLVEQAGVLAGHGLVTLARRGLEPRAGKDGDLTAAIMNESSFLKRSRGNGNRTPSHSEHIREELVREVEVICMRAVVRHQKPAHQPRFDIVELGAGSRLGQLSHEHIQVAVQRPEQAGAVVQSAPELRSRHSQCGAGPLDYSAQRRSSDAQGKGRAEHALVADHPDFQRFVAVDCRRQRNDTREGKYRRNGSAHPPCTRRRRRQAPPVRRWPAFCSAPREAGFRSGDWPHTPLIRLTLLSPMAGAKPGIGSRKVPGLTR